MKRLRFLLLTLMASVMVVSLNAQPALAMAGSWTGTDYTTTSVYWKGQYVNGATIAPPSWVSPTAVITDLSWKYSVTYPYPAGGVVELCDLTWGQCLDVTGYGSWRTSAFNGRPATDKFYFRAGVIGSGSQSPVWKIQTKSITVSTWQ